MTTEQKNSYLEAHMEVQQHMHQVSMQLNHSTSNNQNMINNQSHSSSMNTTNPYFNTNPIKVNSVMS